MEMEQIDRQLADRDDEAEDTAVGSHDAIADGPFRAFYKRISTLGSPPGPLTEVEIANIAAYLPQDSAWEARALDDVYDEIVGFAVDPAVARAYLRERTRGPLAHNMRVYAATFRSRLPSYCRATNQPMPDANRVYALKAILLRLYDVATAANVAARPSTGKLTLHSTRRAS